MCIFLRKTDMFTQNYDSVKSKAMEKLKEINNKNSENCSKAQQYLDSLLKVPFGIYRKEDALNRLDYYKVQLDNHILISLNLISEIKKDENLKLTEKSVISYY